MKKVKVIDVALALTLAAGLIAQGANYYVDVNYDGLNGGYLGTSTAPWNTLGAAVTPFTSNPGSIVYVANGEYKSSLNSGLETFGTGGYNLAGTGGSWKGGYAGYTGGGAADWTTRTLPTESVTAPASTTVINLSNANSRAFVSSGYEYGLNFEGFVFRDSNVSQANYDGGALYLNGGYGAGTWVRDSVFLNNRTTRDGGGLWVCGRGGVSQNLVFINNQANGAGGGLYQGGKWSDSGAGTTLKTSLFRNNSAANGGGLYNMQNLDQVRFESNVASAVGGGANLGEAQNSYYKRCTFIGNQAGTYGGAVGNASYKAGSLTLENCLIVKNTAPAGGYAVYDSGAYSQDGNASMNLMFTTIADNTGGGMRSTMGTYGGGTALNFSVRDSIIANNGAVGLSLSVPGGLPTVINIDYNDIYNQTTNYSGVSAGANDNSLNPLFIDSASGNYRLALGSPDIDTGILVAGITTDLQGWWRPLGLGFDRGAYEAPEPAALSLLLFSGCWLLRRRRR